MSPALTLVVLTLAAFRVTRLLIDDSVIDRQRVWVETRLQPSHRKGLNWRKGHPKALEFIGCPWCLGHYVSLGAAVVGGLWMGLPYWFVAWWAISAAQSMIYLVHNALSEWMDRG